MVVVSDTIDPPESVISSLKSHLPYSLALLRRIQFMKNIKGGQTPNSHILHIASAESPDAFAAAYLDFSRGPETELWVYSSLEKGQNPEVSEICSLQVLKIFSSIKEIENVYRGARERQGIVCFGCVHEKVLKVLENYDAVKAKTAAFSKFIFDPTSFPKGKPLFDQGLEWGIVKKEDVPLVLSRTHIPRKERTLSLLPSAAIRLQGELIAWGFLGPDGSLTSLHCEEKYRGKGLAKAVALKLFLDRISDYSQDRLCHADVAEENTQSQGLCRSLGGVADWLVYWTWIDVTKF